MVYKVTDVMMADAMYSYPMDHDGPSPSSLIKH